MTASFKSTVNPPTFRRIVPADAFLVDRVTGAPIGIQNASANGFDGQFYPVPLTAAQIASPTKAMLDDINVTYCLNVAPYTRYCSDGSQLIAEGGNVYGGSYVTIPSSAGATTVGKNAGGPLIFFESLTIQNSGGVTAVGPGLIVEAYS